MGMNVNLTPQLDEMVRAKVDSGQYSSASEVVREALRMMQERDQLREVKLEALRRDIQQGMDSGASEAWNSADLKAMARAKRNSKRSVTA